MSNTEKLIKQLNENKELRKQKKKYERQPLEFNNLKRL